MSVKSVKFRGRHMSVRALIAIITGSIAIITYAVMSVLTVLKGGADSMFGFIGMAMAIVSLAGVIVSTKAMEERDIFVSTPIAGIIVNGVGLLIYVVTYFIGLV